MISNKKLIKQFEKHKTQAFRALREQKADFKTAQDYYAGVEQGYSTGVTEDVKIMVGNNIVKPYVDAINGFMIQNRRQPMYNAALTDSQEQKARSSYINHLSQYVRENNNADQIESKQDLDLVCCGLGVVDTNLTEADYEATTDPHGEIIKEHVPLDEIWYDPAATGTNLMDATYVFRAKKFHREEAENLFDEPESSFTNALPDLETARVLDVAENVMVELDADRIEKDMVNVFYYQWYEINTFYRLRNPIQEIAEQFSPDAALQTLEQFKILKVQKADTDKRVENQEDLFTLQPEDEWLILTPSMKALAIQILTPFIERGMEFDFKKAKKKEYFTAIISGTKVFTKYKNIDQTGFSLKFKTGYYNVSESKWFGTVKALQEPSDFFNKTITEILDIIAASSKNGLLYEKSAVEDAAKLERDYAINGSVIEFEDGAISGNKIREKQTPSGLGGYGDLLPLFAAMPDKTTGLGPEFFGIAGGANESGVLQRQRIKRVISLLAIYFDSITLYQKADAQSMLPLMRILAQESEGRLFSIVGENGAQTFQKLGLNEFADRYEVSIGEAPDTDTAKQENVETVLAIIDRLLTTVPDKGLEVMKTLFQILPNMPNDMKQKLTNNITDPEPTEEQQQEQQKQKQLKEFAQQIEIQKAQGENKKLDAETQKLLSSLDESESKVRESESKIIKNIADSKQKDAETDILESQQGEVESVSVVI